MARRRKGCWIAVAALVVVIAAASPWLYQVAMALRDAQKAGLLGEEQVEKYRFGRENNLKAIRAALVQSADSDGGFPAADQWMDAALTRLKTGDLTEAEARAKLRRPGLTDGYGYALNASVAGRHPDDFKEKPGTVLVFESKATAWGASGDPEADCEPEGLGVTLAGDVVLVKG